jgi:hypothetical protein
MESLIIEMVEIGGPDWEDQENLYAKADTEKAGGGGGGGVSGRDPSECYICRLLPF